MDQAGAVIGVEHPSARLPRDTPKRRYSMSASVPRSLLRFKKLLELT